MNEHVLGIDAYQLTTLVAHAAAGRLSHEVAMSAFFRRLPAQRNFVVFAGLLPLLRFLDGLSFRDEELRFLRDHPLFGPAFAKHPEVLAALAAVDGFEGEIEALPEGTLAFAGTVRTTAGEPLRLGAKGATLGSSTPLLQLRTDLVRAKLVETPLLSRINHLSMIASKAIRVVLAAGGRPVTEFGQRRTHPDAAIDASYAAWLAGCAGTSNVAAEARYGVPARGTMDHFAVQACARPGEAPEIGERVFFEQFLEIFPGSVLLVDTYDTRRGTIAAAEVGGERLGGVRLDSAVTPALVRETRALLDAHGAPHAKILVSDGLDEWRVRELAEAGADAFGVGENIACVPDAACGIGAVAKLNENGYGRTTMKVASASGKATLPGPIQVWRGSDHDLLTLADEGGPAGATPLLVPVWKGRAPLRRAHDAAHHWAHEARARVKSAVDALPSHLRGLETDHGRPWPIVASDRLAERARELARLAEGSRP